MNLTIGLDVTPEVISSTGVARYSRELRLALERRDDCTVRAFALGRRNFPLPEGVRGSVVPLRLLHGAWALVERPRAETWTGPVDIVHSLDLQPPPTRRPLAVTVHDVVTQDLPELHPRRSWRMQSQQLRHLPRAAAVLANSGDTAAALRRLGVPPTKLHVTHLGVGSLAAPLQEPVIRGSFVLSVGTLEPRKAHRLLVEAFAELRPDARLVFAGPDGGCAEALRHQADELGIGEQLLILGRVDEPTLSTLYRDATLLCLPSLAEGFGLPVVEAMAAGLPVLASDLPCFREVGGEAVEFVPRSDAQSLTGRLRELLEAPERRARLAEAGRNRARRFSWDATAAATVAAYTRAIELSGGPAPPP